MSIYEIDVKFAFPHSTTATGDNSASATNLADQQNLISYVNLELNTLESVVHWTGLGPRDFEVAHGITRIVKLVPDKLATALAINREYLDDPADDGSYLIELIDKLLMRYEEIHQKNPKKIVPDDSSHFYRPHRLSRTRDPWPQPVGDESCAEPLAKQMKPRFRVHVGLRQVPEHLRENGIAESLKRVRMLLTEAKDFLAARDEVGYKETVEKILSACSDLRYLAEAYCKFAHPTLLDAAKKHYFSEDIAMMRGSQTVDHLNRLPDLHAEFLRNLNAV